jgi:hypothetical protein
MVMTASFGRGLLIGVLSAFQWAGHIINIAVPG